MMALDPSHTILCCYTNRTSQFQIIRISNIPYWFFERAVTPKGTVLFEAIREAQLEIHTSQMMDSILSDTIPCVQLIHSRELSMKRSRFIPKTA